MSQQENWKGRQARGEGRPAHTTRRQAGRQAGGEGELGATAEEA